MSSYGVPSPTPIQPTYLELLDYAAQIGDGLASITLEDILGDEAAQAEQAMKFSVGHRHWATYARSMQLVRGAATKTPPSARVLAEAAPALCSKDPVRFHRELTKKRHLADLAATRLGGIDGGWWLATVVPHRAGWPRPVGCDNQGTCAGPRPLPWAHLWSPSGQCPDVLSGQEA